MAKEKTKYRITLFMATLLVTVAFLFDLLEIALLALVGVGVILNRLVVIIKWGIYIFWLYSLGVPTLKLSGRKAQRRALVLATTFVVGMIPVLGALPEFTLGILVTTAMVRFEDATGVSTLAAFDARKALKKGGRTLSRKRVAAEARRRARLESGGSVATLRRNKRAGSESLPKAA